jgi:CheY-like chemotaxis protein
MLHVRKNTLGSWRARHPYTVRKNVVKHPTLLVVDDDEHVIRVAKRLLGDTFDIATARTADEAAQLLRIRSFDTILTDYDMPGKNGIWLLLEAMRTHPQSRRVLFSGSTPQDLPQHLHSGVVHCFIPKPTSRSELIASLSHA